jgi:homoserine O-succinyltransferase
MPVAIARKSVHPLIAELRERRIRRGTIRDRGRRLRLELVNNMPDTAIFATQRQFIRLIEDGARDFEVTLGLTTLETVARSDELRREMAQLYRSPQSWEAEIPDAILVTGAEPRAASLDQELYWRELVEVFDFAAARAHSTLASCLAAHALALHLDGVPRRRAARKWSGLYLTEIADAHPLTEALPPGLTPHSRWNGLDEADLRAAGYVVLTRSAEAGVDMFLKDDGHLRLLFQGHPEYDADTLAREYRRDALRAIKGGSPAPAPPVGYYTPDQEARLRDHVAAMIAGREAPHMPAEAMQTPPAAWRRRGGVVIENWLNEIAARKNAASGPLLLRARYGG